MKTSLFSGWNIFLANLIGFVALIVLSIQFFDNPAETAIRGTARYMFVFYILTFAASPLKKRWKNGFTTWLRSNRRFLGLSFAVAYVGHLGTLAWSYLLTNGAAFDDRTLGSLTPGIAVMIMLSVMFVTSFPPTYKWLGKRWGQVHTAGMYLFAVIFMVSNGERAITGSILHIAITALLISVLFLRISSMIQKRKTVSA